MILAQLTFLYCNNSFLDREGFIVFWNMFVRFAKPIARSRRILPNYFHQLHQISCRGTAPTHIYLIFAINSKSCNFFNIKLWFLYNNFFFCSSMYFWMIIPLFILFIFLYFFYNYDKIFINDNLL